MTQDTPIFSHRCLKNGEKVKVLLEKIKVYHQCYNGINFFVYHGLKGRSTWDAIERTTGLSIVTDRISKKVCIEDAHQYIDNHTDIQERIYYAFEKSKNIDIISIEEMRNRA